MKTIATLAILLITIGSLALSHARADAPAPQRFVTRLSITDIKDGQPATPIRPTLVASDGQEARFLLGDETPIDEGGKESLPVGLQATIKVHQAAPDQLRVTIYAGQSDLDSQGESNFLIHESGVHCVRTIKPGEPIEIAVNSHCKLTAIIQAADENR